MSEASESTRIWSIAISALILVITFTGAAVAQGSSLYIYPLKNQNQEKQDRDRYECHSWAVQQTRYDPSRAYPNNPTYLDPQPYRPSQPHMLKGAVEALPWML